MRATRRPWQWLLPGLLWLTAAIVGLFSNNLVIPIAFFVVAAAWFARAAWALRRDRNKERSDPPEGRHQP